MSGYQDKNLQDALISRSHDNGFEYPLRVLLYSHDSVGLGHLRRNLAIAGEIATTFPNSSILIVTGSPCATQFKLPANTDLVKIPSITKDRQGRYVHRNFSGSLDKILEFRTVTTGDKDSLAVTLENTGTEPLTVEEVILPLEEMLKNVAIAYDREVEMKVSRLTSLLEPMMILIMGAVVGFIAMSIVLPIFKMSSIVK